jgi:phosphoglucosamine mutase
LQDKVLAEKADIGVALDGDADRLIMVDEKGQIIDGDQLLALLAIAMQENDGLAEHAVVATVMSNLGLERFLEQNDIDLIRTGVGDRYVMEAMRMGGFNLGGEQSGHIILSDFSRTGDGLLAALQVLLYLKAQSVPASACLQMFTAVPQLLKNVRYDKSVNIMSHEDILSAIDAAQARLANDGRLLVRPSGTEPVIRVMAEGDDDALVQSVVNDLCETIQKYGKAV